MRMKKKNREENQTKKVPTNLNEIQKKNISFL